ncbi:DsrE/DsrF/TusD sulfur relay family protein [Neobacillus sp. SM06]|uniref:DsrE/DsrF/TusD sulfur relay family protein n=1 Tax=Neobacillus sp. SM06 TaxID=3422492 RepID=UPI003D2E96E4
MKFLVIVNDPPYGTEKAYNAFRQANAIAGKEDTEVRVFLIADAAACAKVNQKTPNGYYNLEKMLTVAKRKGVVIGVCGSCMDARGISEEELHESAHKSTMDELADWSIWADKMISY